MDNNLLLQQQKDEAIKRMQILRIMPKVINDFRRSGRVYYSERQNKYFDGILYYVDNDERYIKIIKDFEKNNNALVYHAQLTHFVFGRCLSLLYVSKDTTTWDMDKDDLKNGIAFSYVENLDDKECSEFGTIGVVGRNGGVSRTA